ncbi:hypothetical protein K439DRAFT_1631038 [Ramaria rubella]|nr:hypothetical protein K439DRAFT_1631038 [Ramaria rubella]
MHLILTGATGTCGAAVLKHCLAEPSITRLTILARRPVALADGHAKATVLIHEDFTQYPQTVLDQMKGAEGCIWALGISQRDVNKEEYVKITYDYTMAAATAFSTLSSPFKFVFVSGEGADPTEKSRALFAKIKGRAEKDLYELSKRNPSLRVFAARPGAIDPEGEHLKPGPPPGFSLLTILGPVMRRYAKSYIIGTQPLARALSGLAVGNGEPIPAGDGIEAEGRTLRNWALRRLAGL